jgi:hypothetical protein
LPVLGVILKKMGSLFPAEALNAERFLNAEFAELPQSFAEPKEQKESYIQKEDARVV